MPGLSILNTPRGKIVSTARRVSKRHDDSHAGLRQSRGFKLDPEMLQWAELAGQGLLDRVQGGCGGQRLEALKVKSQLESEPAVAGENLAQLVQRRAALGKCDQALLGRCIGAKRGLVAEDQSHVGAGKSAQEERKPSTIGRR